MDLSSPFRFENFGLKIWRGEPKPMRRRHSHTEIELNFLNRGQVAYLFAGQRVPLRPGGLFVFGGLTPHELVEVAPGTDFYFLTVPLTAFMHWQLPENIAAPILRGEILVDEDSANDARRFARWWEDLEGADPRRARVTLPEVQARFERMALSTGMRSAWQRQSEGAADRPGEGTLTNVEHMLHTIAERFAEPLTLRELARRTGWHPHYAAGEFRRRIGVSPVEFLLRQRIAHARHLLVTTDAKVITIAHDCGFSTLSSFYAAFVRLTGKPPGKFRKRRGL
jgi:AraC-like DNA-binding protein